MSQFAFLQAEFAPVFELAQRAEIAPSVIPANAGIRAPAMAHKQRGGSPRQDQPQIL